jgi:hypothetical protein
MTMKNRGGYLGNLITDVTKSMNGFGSHIACSQSPEAVTGLIIQSWISSRPGCATATSGKTNSSPGTHTSNINIVRSHCDDGLQWNAIHYWLLNDLSCP